MSVCATCFESASDPEVCENCGRSPLLDGRYEIVRVLGEGAQGVSYLARTPGGSELFAIKEFVLGRASGWKPFEQFEREAKALRDIDHPSVPRFVETFSVESGRTVSWFVVREYVEGTDLAALGRLRAETAFRIGIDVLRILADLHELPVPIVHRDIKPANLMRREDGEIVIVDFGSVRSDRNEGSTIAGTFGYMAPEQFAGRAVPESDVFAVGATILALVSGTDPSEFLVNLSHDWRGRVALAPAFEHALGQLLESDPADRPSAREASALLENALAQKSLVASSAPAPVRVAKRSESSVVLRPSSEVFPLTTTLGPWFGVGLAALLMWFGAAAVSAIPEAWLLKAALALLLLPVLRLAYKDRQRQLRQRQALSTGERVVGRIANTSVGDTGVVCSYLFEVPGAARPFVGAITLRDIEPIRRSGAPLIAYLPDDPDVHVVAGWDYGAAAAPTALPPGTGT